MTITRIPPTQARQPFPPPGVTEPSRRQLIQDGEGRSPHPPAHQLLRHVRALRSKEINLISSVSADSPEHHIFKKNVECLKGYEKHLEALRGPTLKREQREIDGRKRAARIEAAVCKARHKKMDKETNRARNSLTRLEGRKTAIERQLKVPGTRSRGNEAPVRFILGFFRRLERLDRLSPEELQTRLWKVKGEMAQLTHDLDHLESEKGRIGRPADNSPRYEVVSVPSREEILKAMHESRPLRRRLGCLAAAVILAAGHAEAADVVFREADGMSWTIHDIAVYNKHKAEIDGFVSRLSPATKPLGQWFGPYSQNPYRVLIKNGGCSIGFTFEAPPRLTVNDSCIINKTTADEQKWARQVSWLFMGYAIWPAVSMGWPGSGWIDPVFKVMQADIVGQLEGPAAAAAVEADLDTEVKRSQYKFHRDFRNAHGWQAYQEMLALMKAEKIEWNRIDLIQSPLRANYIYAYLSLAIRKKQGEAAKAAGMAGVSGPEVMDILRARNLLLIADRKGKATDAAWTAFRAGRHAEVKTLLPGQP